MLEEDRATTMFSLWRTFSEIWTFRLERTDTQTDIQRNKTDKQTHWS